MTADCRSRVKTRAVPRCVTQPLASHPTITSHDITADASPRRAPGKSSCCRGNARRAPLRRLRSVLLRNLPVAIATAAFHAPEPRAPPPTQTGLHDVAPHCAPRLRLRHRRTARVALAMPQAAGSVGLGGVLRLEAHGAPQDLTPRAPRHVPARPWHTTTFESPRVTGLPRSHGPSGVGKCEPPPHLLRPRLLLEPCHHQGMWQPHRRHRRQARAPGRRLKGQSQPSERGQHGDVALLHGGLVGHAASGSPVLRT
jgi:hypothetical protein